MTPGTRLGPYEIVAPIGAGGMGEVYRARDTTLDRDVALKILTDAFVLDADRRTRFEREANANEAVPRISPDETLLAYQSDASGRWEVHVQPFPRGEGRIQVSVGGGQHPMWSPRGGEIFYVAGNDLMAVEMAHAPALRAGPPRRLFSGEALGTRLSVPTKVERRYAVFPDGRRFVVVRGNGAGTSDVVLADGMLTRVAPEGRH